MLRTTREPLTAGHAAPKRAVRGPAVGCAARGAAFLQGLPPNPMVAAPRGRGGSKTALTRRDAHGLVGLWTRPLVDFCATRQLKLQKTHGATTKLPA